MTGLKGSKKNVLEKIEVETKAIKEEKQSDESKSLGVKSAGEDSSDSLTDEIGESEEDESESFATKSNRT